jgi:hypothetical protein
VLAGEQDSSGLAVTLSGPTFATTLTDGDGAYTFSGLADGSYTVSVAGPSTRERTRHTTVEVSGDGSLAPPLSLTPLGAIVGTIVLGDGARHRAGVLVFADDGSAAVATDEAGSFRLEGVSVGTRRVQAAADGYDVGASHPVAVRYAQNTDIGSMTLDRTPTGTEGSCVFRGRALLPGQAEHSGIEVRLHAERHTAAAVTDATGRFELTGVPTGAYTLSFSKGEYSEFVPKVVALPGTDGMLVDGFLYPMPAITLSHGHRIPDSADSSPSETGTKLVAFPRDEPYSVLDLDAGTRTLLDDQPAPYRAELPMFSPDESRLLFRGASIEDFWAVPLKGGPAVRVGTQFWQFRGFSGDQFIYAEQTADPGFTGLRVGSIFGGPARQIALQVFCAWDRGRLTNCPEVSPDGRFALFLERHKGSATTFAAMSVPIRGGPPNLLGAPTLRLPTVSKDGSRALVFHPSPKSDVQFSLTSVPVAGGAGVPLADSAYDAKLSPDGKKVLVLDDRKVLKSLPSAGGAATELATGVSLFSFSPDGTRALFFQDGTTMLSIVSIEGGPATLLATGLVVRAEFTADGANVVYVEKAPSPATTFSLKTVAVTGRSSVELSSDLLLEEHATTQPRLSPDGRHVYFFERAEGGQLLKGARTSSGTATALGLIPGYLYAAPLWTRGGEILSTRNGLTHALAHQNGAYLLKVP